MAGNYYNTPPSLYLSSEPASEPVTTTEAKAHLRITHTDDDTLVDSLVKSARQWCEDYCRRAFIAQTWKMKWDDFPHGDDEIVLRRPPLVSVSSVQYIDSDGVTQTWDSSDYTVDTESIQGRIYPNYNEDYPVVRDIQRAVTVTYVAGYGNASAVPQSIKDAIRLHVELLYAAPDPEYGKRIEMARDALLGPYRVVEI